MKNIILTAALVVGFIFVFPVAAEAQGNSCWGQASAVFAQTGLLGEHSSQQPNPRLGLRNLARLLAELGGHSR